MGNVGFKLGFFGPFSGDVGACWRQDGEQERQDGDQERQNEPRWANLNRKSERGLRGTRAAAATWARVADPVGAFKESLEFDIGTI